MPHVTTVLPVYNAAAFLPATLASLAAQTRRPDRIVVLDDCSTDDTVRLAEAFAALPCEVVRHERNAGLFPNHNRALAYAAETDFLHLLHGDDLIRPTFYARMLATATVTPGRSFVYCDHEIIDAHGTVVRPRHPRPVRPDRHLSVRRFILRQAEMHPIMLHSALLQTDRHPAPCLFRLDLPQVADTVFHAEWARSCDTVVEVRETLVAHREHAGTASSRNRHSVSAAIGDEWRAMHLSAALLGETGWRRRCREARLALLFGMLTELKFAVLRRIEPALVAPMRAEAARLAGARWLLAGRGLAQLRRVAIRARLLENMR